MIIPVRCQLLLPIPSKKPLHFLKIERINTILIHKTQGEIAGSERCSLLAHWLLVIQEVATAIPIKMKYPGMREKSQLSKTEPKWSSISALKSGFCRASAWMGFEGQHLSPLSLSKLWRISLWHSQDSRGLDPSLLVFGSPQNQISFSAKQLPPQIQSPTL